MITLFTNITEQLTDKEKNLLTPMLLELLKKTSSGHRATSNQICFYFSSQGHSVSGSRLRKMINYIRVTNAAQPFVVIGASNGYYLTTDCREIDDQIESLEGRIDAMKAVIDVLKAQRDSLKTVAA